MFTFSSVIAQNMCDIRRFRCILVYLQKWSFYDTPGSTNFWTSKRIPTKHDGASRPIDIAWSSSATHPSSRPQSSYKSMLDTQCDGSRAIYAGTRDLRHKLMDEHCCTIGSGVAVGHRVRSIGKKHRFSLG